MGGSGVAEPVLTRRALGRATLARQHLLSRVSAPPRTVIDHLVDSRSLGRNP